MNRREFLICSTAALFVSLAGDGNAADGSCKLDFNLFQGSLSSGTDTAPLPEITAAVDVLVPPDPDVAGDFKGSDYGADHAVAAALGTAGQVLVVGILNSYARSVAGTSFLSCTDALRLEALQQWVQDREELAPLVRELLTGLLSLSMIGTFEQKTEAEQQTLFKSMGWYDPDDPSGTFRIPNEGYVDSFQFPVSLKKGLRK